MNRPFKLLLEDDIIQRVLPVYHEHIVKSVFSDTMMRYLKTRLKNKRCRREYLNLVNRFGRSKAQELTFRKIYRAQGKYVKHALFGQMYGGSTRTLKEILG